MFLFHLRDKTISTNCISRHFYHSKRCFLHGMCQMNPSEEPIRAHIPKSLITLSFALDIEYNLENLSTNDLSPTHKSSQNLILLPLPHLHLILLSNQLASLLTSQIQSRSFNQYEFFLHANEFFISLQCPYLKTIMSSKLLYLL